MTILWHRTGGFRRRTTRISWPDALATSRSRLDSFNYASLLNNIPTGPASRGGRRAHCLFFFFRLLLGWREPFEPLEELLLGHALDCDLGIIGVDRSAGR